jgi:2-amino-4-hydroxy-6-hydroxymethyldihydropteridine diphosphokinase
MPQGLQAQNGNNVLVALGSNVTSTRGDPRETILLALSVLTKTFRNTSNSRLYQTPAFPAGSGPDFVNAACVIQSDLPAHQILDALHAIEADFGRTRDLRWGQRTLDLDLIACGSQVLPDKATYQHWQTLPVEAQKTTAPEVLILPHPRVQDRAFVLIPLADVAPDWRHPVLNLTVTQMVTACRPQDVAKIQAL